MSFLVPIALFGWVPLTVILFSIFRPRTALIASFVAGWLFLPNQSFDMPFLDFNKITAASFGCLLGAAISDRRRLAVFRPSMLDLPAAVFCAAAIATALSNGLGLHEGLSHFSTLLRAWGLPYLLGRLYFRRRRHFEELAIGFLIGGLVYVPLCLFEARMSPQLHRIVYGFHRSRFADTMRFGGYRPTVFLQHGLAVALWMANAAIIGLCVWRSGLREKILGIGASTATWALLVTTIVCKSVNAAGLLLAGLAIAGLTRRSGSKKALAVLFIVPVLYIPFRMSGLVERDTLVSWARSAVNEERAASLQFRLVQEELFSEKAMLRPWLGWGRFGRMFPTDPETGLWLTRGVDSFWIVTFGTNGLVGLISWLSMMTLPALLLIVRMSRGAFHHPRNLPLVGLMVVVGLFVVDCLFNAMVNPCYTLTAGGLASLCIAAGRRREAEERAGEAAEPEEETVERVLVSAGAQGTRGPQQREVGGSERGEEAWL